MSLKSLAFLVLSFLVVPGSGFLVWDGLPLSGRIEFASLALFVVVFLSRETRKELAELLQKVAPAGLFTPILAVLITFKLLSFVWAPVGDGFQSCYRSLYNPLAEQDLCEKSYEGPFLRDGGLPMQNISRVDSSLDFGKRPYDWSLPFMNEYPRLGAMWLQRFPFESQHYAAVQVDQNNSVLPVLAIGELSVSIDNRQVTSLVNYERPVLSAVPLPKGRSEVLITLRYRDEDRTDPETPPEPRGPYAQLKVGEPMSGEELLDRTQLVIVGVSETASDIVNAEAIVVQNKDGAVIQFKDLGLEISESRKQFLQSYDFEIAVAAESLNLAPLRVLSNSSGGETVLATIESSDRFPFSPKVTQSPSSDSAFQLGAHLTVERSSLQAFRPEAANPANPGIKVLLLISDLSSLLISALLAFLVFRVLRSTSFLALGMAVIVWIAIEPLDDLIPSLLGGGRELVIPYALVSSLVLLAYRRIVRYPLLFLLPTATVLASQKVFEHIYFNHPGEGQGWWGKLLYYWRDSDWYVAQGYARTIFTEGSLRGGESIFWFQSGPRYLALATRLLLGENDVLVGLIFVTLGFLVVWLLASRFLEEHVDLVGRCVAVAVLFLLQIFLGDQIITAFGFVVSSEYPTWLMILGVSALALRHGTESRTWFTSTVAGAVALTVHFRPNLIIVSFALLILILLKTERPNEAPFTRQNGWTIATYVAIIPLSLIHNLYYGQSFVPFASNAGINYAFNWTELFEGQTATEGIAVVWAQLRSLMYWRIPHDPNFAIVFWGSQLMFVLAMTLRARRGLLKSWQSAYLLIPATYVGPMLKFQYESYYPRHLVAASLLCLCSALLAWPKTRSDVVSTR